MHKFEVRFADTGFPRKFENMSSIEMLQQQIFKQYKIEKCNQKIFSKKGAIVTNQSRLDNQNMLKKTYSGDANNPQGMSESLGFYLFNHKELLKNYVDDTADIGSQNVLQKMRQTSQQLRTNIYQLEPLDKKFTQDQILKINLKKPFTNVNLQQIANTWLALSTQVVDVGLTYKQNQSCFDQYIERWENQRKALVVLSRNLQNLTSERKINNAKVTEFLKNTKAKFQQHHNIEDIQKLMSSSLVREEIRKEKSAYSNQVIYISNQIKLLTGKLNSIQSRQQSIDKKVFAYKRRVKQCHIELEKQVKALDEFKRKKSKQLQKISNQAKSNYSNLIEAIKQTIQKSDDSKLTCYMDGRKLTEQQFRKYHQTGIKYNEELQKKFGEMFRLYTEHTLLVRSDYRVYYDIYVECQENLKQAYVQLQNQISRLYNSINELTQYKNNQEKQEMKLQRQTKLLPQLEQNQFKRRSLFNTKLQCLQEQLKQILKQQESSRKKYMQEMLLINEMYDNQILSNIQVPCLLFNFDQSSDRQLMVKMKSSSRGRDMKDAKQNGFSQIDVEMYRECMGMDRILRQLEIVKNCQVSLKSDNIPNQTKIKNLQTLLQKSSDIFHRIYSHKLTLHTKQHSLTLQSHLTRITTLEAENKQLHHRIYTYTQNISSDIQNRKELEIQVEKLKNQLEEAISYRVQIENSFEKNMLNLENRIKAQESTIESNKKQINLLKQQKKDMQQNLTHLVSSTETLFTQLQNSSKTIKQLQQINHEYKIVMGDQAIKIATLQTQLQISRQEPGVDGTMMNDSQIKLKESFYGNNLNLYLNKPQNKNLTQQPQTPTSQNMQQPPNNNNQQQIQQTLMFGKNNKSITSQQLKQIQRQIGKLEKQIQELKEENEELKRENQDLNKEILEIAMKDTEDVEVQTEEIGSTFGRETLRVSNMENNSVIPSQHIKIDNLPQAGELRLFIPFTNGLYIAIKSTKNPQHRPYSPLNYLTSQTRNYINIHQTELISQQQQSTCPYILDMNCLTSKARQLLTECTLVVVLRVSKILPGSEKYYVEGEIVAAMGFEDEDLGVKDYGPFLR